MGRSRDRNGQQRRAEHVAHERAGRGETRSVRHSDDRERGRSTRGASGVRGRRSSSSSSGSGSSRSTSSISSSISRSRSSGSDRGSGDTRTGIKKRGDGAFRYSRSRSRERNHDIKARHRGSGEGSRKYRDSAKHQRTSSQVQRNGDSSAARFDHSRRYSSDRQDSRGDRRLESRDVDRGEGSSHRGGRGGKNAASHKSSRSPDRRRVSSPQSRERPSSNGGSGRKSGVKGIKASSSRLRRSSSEDREAGDKDRRISSHKSRERASSNGGTGNRSFSQGGSASFSQRRSSSSQERDAGDIDRRGSSVKSRERASSNSGGGSRNCVQGGSASSSPWRNSSSQDRDTGDRRHRERQKRQRPRSGLSDRSREDENGRYSEQPRSRDSDEASESHDRRHKRDRSHSRNGRLMSPESGEAYCGSRKSASGSSDTRSGRGEEEGRPVETSGGSGTEGDVSRRDRVASVVGVSGSPGGKTAKKKLAKHDDAKGEISRRNRVASFDAVSASPSGKTVKKRLAKHDDGVGVVGEPKRSAVDGGGLNGDFDEILPRKKKKKKKVVMDIDDGSLTPHIGPTVTPRCEAGVLGVQSKAAAADPVVKKEREPTAEENDLIKDLRDYLKEHHVRNIRYKLQGWRARVRKRAKYSSHTYLDPEGREYMAKGQVLATVQAAEGSENERHQRLVISREEAIQRAEDLFEKRGAELVGDRGPEAPPVQVSDLLVENLGKVDTRPGFHSSKSIFPPGYQVLRLVIDGRSLRAIKARCTIYVEDDAPAFRVEVLGSTNAEGKPTTFEAPTQKGVFGQMFEALGTAGRRAKESVLGGPAFFNPAVKALIEGMPGSSACANYVYMAMKPCRGSGDVPMFKKDDSAAAAERAEERLRGDLEKLWWNGLGEDEKAKQRVAERHTRKQDEPSSVRKRSKMRRSSKDEGASESGAGAARPRKAKILVQKRKKDPSEDKRRQLFPVATREVQSFINAMRKEARGMVLGRFDAEQRGLMTDSGAVEDSLLDGFSKPWPRPSSASGGSGCSDLTVVGREGRRPVPRLGLPKGVRLEDAVQVWNAVCVFPRPMGLRPPPTLEELMEAIEALSPKSSEMKEEGAATRGGGAEVVTESAAAVEAGATCMGQLHEINTALKEEEDDEDEEAEFDDRKACIRATGSRRAGNGQGRGRGGGEVGGKAVEDKEVAKKEAQAKVDRFCMAVVRMLAGDLHTVLGSPCDPPREKPRESVTTEDVLVVNQLTWPELARQCIVANMTKECLSMTDAEVTGWVRGGERHWATERPVNLLLRRRVEHKWDATANVPTPIPTAARFGAASNNGGIGVEHHDRQEWAAASVAAVADEAEEAEAVSAINALFYDELRGGSLDGVTEGKGFHEADGDADAGAANATVGGGGGDAVTASDGSGEALGSGPISSIAGDGNRNLEAMEDDEDEEDDKGDEDLEEDDGTVLLRRLRALVENDSKPEAIRRCGVVLLEIARHENGSIFLFPEDREQVPEYFDVIERPITVSSLLETLEAASAPGEGDVVDMFIVSVRRMWEDCWSFNHEGTKEWMAAEQLSLVFERLVREWVLRTRPPPPRLESLLTSKIRPCSACGVADESSEAPTTADRAGVTGIEAGVEADIGNGLRNTIICDRCDATYHLRCVRPRLLEIPREEWFCPACVSPGDRDGLEDVLSHPPPSPSGDSEFRKGGWGPSPGVPKALDWSLSQQARRCLETESQARLLHAALRILSRPAGGWLPSPTTCWSPGEWVTVLHALVVMAIETRTIHEFLADADQRSENLRKKVLSGVKMSAQSFEAMLLSVGGTPAVEFWLRLLEAEGEKDLVKSYAEDNDDEMEDEDLGKNSGDCIASCPTADTDASVTRGSEGAAEEGVKEVKAEGASAVPPSPPPPSPPPPPPPPRKTVPRMEFLEDHEDEQRRKRKEGALKASVVERIIDSKVQAEKDDLERAAKSPTAGSDRGGSGGTKAGGGNEGNGGWVAKRKRCGNCAGCRAKSCNECKYCLDSKKNNGPNKLKHPCIKRRCRNMPTETIDWADATIEGGAMGSPEVECEYCFKREKELCSPMVVDLSPEEAEEFLKQQETEQYATGSGLDRIHRKVRFPRLRRAKNANAGGGTSTGPIVHEICAQNMFKARAERAQHKLRRLREQAVEEAIRLGGYRTQPLGRDRHGRYYYRFPGDSCRVFVGPAARDPSDGGEEFGLGDRVGETSILLRQEHATEDLMVYENDGDLEALIGWLNESGQREGPLRAALLRAFPPGRPVAAAEAGAAGGGAAVAAPKEEAKGEGEVEKTIDHGTVDGDGDGGAELSVDDDGDVNMVDGGQGSAEAIKPAEVAADVAAPTGGADGGGRNRKGGRRGDDRGVLAKPSRNQELPRLLEEGLVELRISLNPPGASNNVLLPASEAVVEFDNDGEVDEDDTKGGTVTWSKKKYHAVRLHHNPTGEVLVPAQKQGISVMYEIWRGQQLLEYASCETPFDKNGVYFFMVPKFHRTGTFRLVFQVMPSPVYYVDSVAVVGEPGKLMSAPRKAFKVKPIEFTVKVSPRFAYTGAVAALHKLRAIDFVGHRRRHEGATPVCLDLPFDCEEVACLKAGLLTVLNALPEGALKEGTAAVDEHTGGGEGQGGTVEQGLEASEWTPALRDYWVLHVASATSSQELMEALLLLESCLDPKWLKPWYRSVQEKMPSTSYLLRLSTPAAVGLHLFSLDRAISYDKLSTTANRGSRLRNGIQLRQRAPPRNNTGGTGSNGRRPKISIQTDTFTPPSSKPRGRQSRNSRAAAQAGDDSTPRSPPQRGRPSRQAKSNSRGLSLGSWEDEEEEEEEDDDDDGEDWEPDQQRRRNDGGRARGSGGDRRGRRRAVAYSTDVKEEDMEDDREGEDDESSHGSDDRDNEDEEKGKRKMAPAVTSWECPSCTVGNEISNIKCHLCGERRPASAAPGGPTKRRRHDGGGGGGSSGGGSGSSSGSGSGGDGTASDGDRAVFNDARGGRTGRGRGRVTSAATAAAIAPRQRRQVARVNYAEDDVEEDEEGEEEDRGGSASARGSSNHRTGSRADQRRGRPLRLKEELRRGGGKEEDGLTDEVREFRRRVRSVIQNFSGENFALHFREPVDLDMYPNYVDYVAEPMDLSTILFNLRNGEYDDTVEGRNILLRHIELIPSNCEAFNGKQVPITQNAFLVARTFIGRLFEDDPSMAPSGGSSYSSFGGGAENVCSACGVHLEGDGGSLALVKCVACKAAHHAMCVTNGSGENPWFCVACGREN